MSRAVIVDSFVIAHLVHQKGKLVSIFGLLGMNRIEFCP